MGIVNRDDALYWATGIDTSGLDMDAKKMQQIFSEITDSAGNSVEKMKKNLNESMRQQEIAIGKLETKLAGMLEAYKKVNTGTQDPKIIAQREKEQKAIAEVRAEIELEKKDLADRQQVYDLLGGKLAAIQTRMTSLRNEMAQMRAQGLQNTDQYREMGATLGELGKVYAQVKVEQQGLIKGGGFQGVMAGLNGLAGVMSAGAGAIGLMSGESENYAKVQAKVQSMIAITIGLQQAYNALNETSALRVQTVTKAKQLWNVATQKLTRSQMILMGVLSGGLLLAIGAAIWAIDKIISKQKEQREEAKKLNETITNNAALQITSYERLRKSYDSLGDNMKAKEKFIRDNAKVFDELGIAIRDVADAERLLSDPAHVKKFIQAQLDKARASALMETDSFKKALSKYTEINDKIEKAETSKEAIRKTNSPHASTYMHNRDIEIRELKEQLQPYQKTLEDAYTASYNATKAFNTKMEDINKESNGKLKDTIAGQRIAIKEEISNLEAQRDKLSVKDKKGVSEIDTKLKTAREKLKKLDAAGSSADSTSTAPKDLSAGVIEAQLKLEKERINIMAEGKKKRLELSALEAKEEKARLEKEHAERLLKYKKQKKEMPKEEVEAYNERIELADKAKTNRDAETEKEFKEELKKTYSDLANVFLTEEERKKKAIKDRYDEERRLAKERLAGGNITQEQYADISTKINASETEETRKRLLDGLESFKQQEEKAVKYWDDRIAEIENDKSLTEIQRTEALIQAKKQYNDEINQLNAQSLTQSEEWITLFEQTASLADSEIESLINSIQQKINNGEFKLNPIDAQNFLRSLEQVRGEMKNPIAGMISSFKSYKKAMEGKAKAERSLSVKKAMGAPEEDIKKAEQAVKKYELTAKEAAANIAKDFAIANQMIGSIGDSIAGVMESFGGDTRQLENVTKLLGGVATTGQGIAKMAAGDWVGGITDAVKGIVDVIVSINGISDTERQKRIEALADSVDNLKKNYENMGYAREKAFSTDKADIINQQNENLRKQNDDIQKMIDEEKKKKKTDKGKIKEWQNQIDENNRKIKENKEAAIEAIVGTDIMSAIDQFAQAYADAWESGEKAADKSAKAVKSILKNAFINYMKGQLQPEIDAIMKKIAESMENDGRIDEAEQNAIDALVETLDNKAETYRNALEPYLDNKIKNGVTGELKAAMTEQTGSNLVGLWNMTAMDIREMKEMLQQYGFPDISKDIYNLMNELSAINRNTRETADNTVGIKDKFDAMNDKLEEIKKNTKQNNSRG